MNKQQEKCIELIWEYCTKIQRSRSRADTKRYAYMIKCLCDDMRSIYNVSQKEYDLLLQIKDKPRKEMVKIWKEYTGLSASTLYNRLKVLYLPQNG